MQLRHLVRVFQSSCELNSYLGQLDFSHTHCIMKKEVVYGTTVDKLDISYIYIIYKLE